MSPDFQQVSRRLHGSVALLTLPLLAALADLAPAHAQSNVEPASRHAWSENLGWTDWHDAGAGADGALATMTYLTGWIWSENVGWIHLGDGSPADGVSYANTDAGDWGVNIDPVKGDLSGLAWGENVGWVQFDTGGLGPDRARLDACAHRLLGWAWGENVGWLNLDDAGRHVALVDPSFDLGFAKPGTAGIAPALCIYGQLASGTSAVLQLRDVPPGALTLWFLSVVSTPAPFKGGTLVPVPPLVQIYLVADGNGQIAFDVPGGGGPFDLYWQVAVADSGATLGVSLSNALRIRWDP